MRIPKYWVRGEYSGQDHQGKSRKFWAWGWSFGDLAEATAMAAQRARRIFEHFVQGGTPCTYDYLEHPLREEIVHSYGQGESTAAVVTRNRYGSLVLNTAKVCFVDVDFPTAEPLGLFGSLKALFMAKKFREQAAAAQVETMQRVRQWATRNPRRSFRLYRTAAGLRMLMTDQLYEPNSAEVATLFNELGSDTLYRKLTQKQECFRARLTPKPWRCDCRRPPNRYPWENPKYENAYRKWQEGYGNKTKGFGTCHFLEAFGAEASDETIGGVIELHDSLACCGPEVKLA
jgi:hypothetical protein